MLSETTIERSQLIKQLYLYLVYSWQSTWQVAGPLMKMTFSLWLGELQQPGCAGECGDPDIDQ